MTIPESQLETRSYEGAVTVGGASEIYL